MSQRAPSTEEDAKRMRRLADGDKSALVELIQTHQKWVIELAFRTTGNWVTAEDIGQETFLRVWQSAARYEPRAQFNTWLYRIVVNLCLDALKRRSPILIDPPDKVDVPSNSPSAALEAKECAAKVRQAVAALPVRQRMAVVLHRFSGIPIREIVEITGWTEPAVESLLVRAYAKLRQEFAGLMEP